MRPHRHARPAVRRAAIVLMAAVAATGCSGGGDNQASGPAATAVDAASTTASTIPGVQVGGVRSTRLDDLHGRSVCELDLVHQVSAVVVADIYTTATVNDCDEAAFAAVDTRAVAREQGVPLVLRNGPRVMVLDSLTTSVDSGGDSIQAGGITLEKSATVELDSVSSQQPYRGYTLKRNAAAVYDAGRRVYELHDPNGNTWVMQSYSTHIDPSLDERGLEQLGARLHLPKGWTFSSRELDDATARHRRGPHHARAAGRLPQQLHPHRRLAEVVLARVEGLRPAPVGGDRPGRQREHAAVAFL